MKQNNSIKHRLEQVAKADELCKKIQKFLTTKKGQTLVSKLHTAPLRELCRRYDCQFMLIYRNDRKVMNCIKSSIQKLSIVPTVQSRTQSTCEVKRIKHQIYLSRPQIAEIVARTTPKKFGFAALMHAYEEHKMDKFKKKHPGPTERDLKEDLFPDELVAGYNNMLAIRREHVRNMLCKKYAKTKVREQYFRVFKVLSVTKDPATGREHKPVISEVELDDYISGNQYTSKKDIAIKLKMIADRVRKSDGQTIKVKLYNKYGKLLRTVNFVHKAS